MNLTNRKTELKGDCEACERVDMKLTLVTPGNILMCEFCLAINAEAVERNKHAVQVIEDSRKKDAQIELKQDLFNAGTTSFVELQAAIVANSEIPAERKNYAIMEEVAARIELLNTAIFADEAALLAKKNERHALLVNAQNVAAKLHEKEREKFKQYDVNYKPQAPKSTKPKAIVQKKPAKAFSMSELKAAAAKYNVPLARVQQIAVARNISAEDAAKELATALGLL